MREPILRDARAGSRRSISNLGQGPWALAWLTGDFTGSGQTQIAQPWNDNGQLALIIYGDVNGSM